MENEITPADIKAKLNQIGRTASAKISMNQLKLAAGALAAVGLAIGVSYAIGKRRGKQVNNLN